MSSEYRSPEIYKLLRKGTRATYSKGQVIQSSEGQKTMNFVTKGFVKRYLISDTGHLGVEVIYSVRDFFPLTLILDTLFDLGIYEGAEVYFYEAMTETTVYTVNVDILAEAAKKNPYLYKDLLRETGRRLHTTLNSLENIALKSPYSRVVHQLVYFTQAYGEKLKSGIKITIPLTVQDMGDILSLNKVTVSACLDRLSQQDLIKTGQYFVVPNVDRLKEEAHN
jgi:CRP-like cAMP-binding protein